MTNIVFKWSADVCTKTNTHARDQSLNTSTRHQEVSYVFNKEGTIASQFVCYFSILWAKTAKKQNTYFCNFWHFRLNKNVFKASAEDTRKKFNWDIFTVSAFDVYYFNFHGRPTDANKMKHTATINEQSNVLVSLVTAINSSEHSVPNKQGQSELTMNVTQKYPIVMLTIYFMTVSVTSTVCIVTLPLR